MVKIVTPEQMRRIEERSQNEGVSTDTLMENAGLAVARRVRRHLGRVVGAQVLVLAGPGNNGGDGLVAARHLHSWGARVTTYLCRDRPPGDTKLSMLVDQGATVVGASNDDGHARLREALRSARIVIDAVLGTGRSRPIEGTLRDILIGVAEAKAARPDLQVLALDLPSGVDAATGAADPASVTADVTVTLGYPKVGLYRFPAAEHTGRVEVVDIGVPAGLDGEINLALMTDAWARAILPPRPLSAHKGTFGRTMVVAGSRRYVGAAYLAAAAAARCGAGLVTLAIPEGLAARAAEHTYLPLPESSPGVPSAEAAALILDNVAGYDSLLVGCGLGQAPATIDMLERLLYSGARLPPTVIDADGLNFFSRSKQPAWWQRRAARDIVTPHPGEMSRLTSRTIGEVEADRVDAAVESAVRWGKVTVLKGAYTVVGYPSGEAMLCPLANPAMATAGTGDVLAGAIAGLLAQGLSLQNAAALGVYVHARAGEAVAGDLGRAGMLAGDLLGALPRSIRDIRSGSAD
jgi:NAD(P)H-hydrate epimerase